MKVGLLTYGLDRPLTGIGRYTVELTRALAKAEPGVELTLLAAGPSTALQDTNGYRRAPLAGCRRLPGLLTLGNAMIPRASRRRELEVIHDPTGVTPLLFGGGGAGTVVTVHDVLAQALPGSSSLPVRLIYCWWLPRLLPYVDAVITDSQSSKADIVRYLRVSPSAVRVIPLAAGCAFRPRSPHQINRVLERHGLSAGYLLFVGPSDKRRNLSRLLHAYAGLRREGRCPPLVVVGAAQAEENGLGSDLRRLGLDGRVRFLGRIPDQELAALYSGAGLFVFPTLYEGFGLPALEAMACGAPVVCSNAASLPEVVQDAALLVDPTDVTALAGALERGLRDQSLREEMREKGLARARQFSWQRTARETLEVYRQVLRAR